MKTTFHKASLVFGFTSLLAIATALPAAAHVKVDPGAAERGSYAKLTFRVPDELSDASTTKIQVKFPTDHPIANVSVKPKIGWTSKVTTAKLPKPVMSGDRQITEVVSLITWSGGEIGPGEFDEFEVSVGPLPSDTDQITFPTLQTYSNGDVVAWIQNESPGAPEPEHPAPALHLVDSVESASPRDTTSTNGGVKVAATGATSAQVESANTKAVIGIAVGVVGLLVAGLAVLLAKRRSSRAATDPMGR